MLRGGSSGEDRVWMITGLVVKQEKKRKGRDWINSITGSMRVDINQ